MNHHTDTSQPTAKPTTGGSRMTAEEMEEKREIMKRQLEQLKRLKQEEKEEKKKRRVERFMRLKRAHLVKAAKAAKPDAGKSGLTKEEMMKLHLDEVETMKHQVQLKRD